MATVDSLDIQIAASAKKANENIDSLIRKLGQLTGALKIDTSKLSNIGKNIDFSNISRQAKSMSESMSSAGEKMVQSMKPVQENAKKISRTFEQVKEPFKDIGKGFRIEGSISEIEKAIKRYTNELEKAKLKEQTLSAKGMTDTKGYRDAVADVVKYTNVIESLKKQLDSVKSVKAKTDITIDGKESAEKFIVDYKKELSDLKNDIKSFEAVYGDLSNIPKGMLDTPIESLKISISELKTAYPQATNVISDFENELQRLQSVSGGLTKEPLTPKIDVGEIKSKAAEASEALRIFGEKLKQIEVPEIREDNLQKLQAAFQRTEQKLEELRTKLANGLAMGNISESVDDKGFVRLQEQIAYTEKYAEALREKIEEIGKVGGLERNINIFDGLKNALEGIASAGKKAINSISSALSTIKKFASGIKNATYKLSSMAKSLLGIKNASKGANSSFSSSLKTILKYGLGIRSLYVLFNRLRSAIKEGMKNLVQYSSETNASVSLLSNSMNQLKNASAAMVSPLLNALAPALNAIIQLCIKAVNAINQLFSALTGKSVWIKATKQTADYAAGLGKANKAAEKLYSTTLGIDELNINAGEQDTGGGGGAGGISAEDMFETVPIENKFLDFVQKLKDAWENADFTEIGEILGIKLKNALDKINWEPIKETAAKIGKSLGTLINGFVEVEGLADSIGNTIGEAINTGITGINAFLDNTHWDSVGKFIGDTLNGLVDSIDWGDLGHFFAEKWNAIFDVIGNAAKTFKWSDFGKKLADGINKAIKDFNWSENGKSLGELAKGLLDTLITLLEETNWQELGNGIADFIGGIDWKGIIERLAEGIGAALGGLAALIWGMIEDAWGNVVTWWKETAFEDGKFTITGLLNGILDINKNIGTWIKENIAIPFLDGFAKAFGIGESGGELFDKGKKIILGVITGMSSSSGLFTETLQNIYDNYISPWFTAEKWSELWTGVQEGIALKWQEIQDWWQNTAIYTWWEENVAPWFSADTWFGLANGIKEGIAQKWNETVTQWGTNITLWWNKHVAPWFTKDRWTTILSSIPQAFKDSFKNAANGAIGMLNKVIDAAEKMANSVIDALNSIKVDIPSWIPGIGGNSFGLNLPKVSIPRIPQFEMGGFPEDGLFYANHNELVGEFTNGRTAVANNEMIVEGIKNGVRDAVAEILAPYLADIAQNTRETADKDFGVTLEGRETVDWLRQQSDRMGVRFAY